MKFGVCLGVTPDTMQKAKKALDMGFDFIETNIGCVVSMTEEEIDRCAALQKEEGIQTPCANLLFPGWKLNRDIHLTGAERDLEWEAEYMAMLMPRCASLGIQTLVFGSGGARNIPEGYNPETGFAELTDLCRRLGDAAAPYGITIAIEPLRRQECNIIQTVEDGFRLAKAANHPNVKLLADIYHVYSNEESVDYTQELASTLAHVHWAEISDRSYPIKATPQMEEFAEVLKKNGYNKTVSIEGDAKDFDHDAPLALSTLKKLF